MAGVGKLMKQAAKMQKKMQELQEELGRQEIDITSGGGAVKVTVTLQQEVRRIEIDEEFLREEKAIVEETLLEGVRAALQQSKERSDAAMSELAEGLQMPGLPPGLF